MMQILRYKVEFLTPAFLGDAGQSGRWRTPPFKALLRQFWRMAYFEQVGAARWQLDAMRAAEAKLFGTAADGEGESNRSELRLRLSRWDEGKLKAWQSLETVTHPEVKFPVAADLYMGYGPVTLLRGARQAVLKSAAAIQAGEHAELSIALPVEHAGLIQRALALIQQYGTLGGRSRNGWGSIHLDACNDESRLDLLRLPKSCDWKHALQLDWAHALGHNERGTLEWQSAAQADWQAAMTLAARLKIGLRGQFLFGAGHTQQPEARHWLSYPVTNHSVGSWDKNARLPNSLRFKLRRDAECGLRMAVFHMPCNPITTFHPQPVALEKVWAGVHQLLDTVTLEPAKRQYSGIADPVRREALRPHLNKIQLARVKPAAPTP